MRILATSVPDANPVKVRTDFILGNSDIGFSYRENRCSSSAVPLSESFSEIEQFLSGIIRKDETVPKRVIDHWAGNCLFDYVPVVGRYGKPLMPCHPARADELIRKGKAIRRFLKGIFYIQLLYRKTGTTQRVVCGIDPGSKEEAFTVMSAKRIFLNIQADAANGKNIKKKLKQRSMMRRNRRQRNTPYRLDRKNKKRHGEEWLPPSTRSRWEWKLRVALVLSQLFPIEWFVVEDIKAKTIKKKYKNHKSRWNMNFSPIQHGKNFFYSRLLKIANVMTVPGYITAQVREALDLKKDKKRGKEGKNFYRHCVDSYCLAWLFLREKVMLNTRVTYIAPLSIVRRKLSHLEDGDDGERGKYGGTNKCGFKQGSLVKHKKHGVMIVRGQDEGKLKVVSPSSHWDLPEKGKKKKDPRRTVNPKDCIFLAHNAWYITRDKQPLFTSI